MTLAAAQFAMIRSTEAANVPPVRPGTHTSFASLKQIDAGDLNVGYAEAGPADGPVVMLLHGWPYDIHSYVDVAPLLASAGYRVIVPYVRGCGTTRFLSSATIRNGQQSVVAADVIAMMDALKIQQAIFGGYDWGARSADIVAALWPERCKALVSVSGYLIGSQKANEQPLPPKAELEWWYQYYFATERGVLGYDKYRHDFGKLIWQLASPRWEFDDATFDRTAASFNNPDYVAIVIHNYRWRLGLRMASGSTMSSKSGFLQARLSLCRQLRLRAMPTARLTRNPACIAPCFPANMSIGSSAAASDTICRRKHRRLSRRRSWTWTNSDGLHRRPRPRPRVIASAAKQSPADVPETGGSLRRFAPRDEGRSAVVRWATPPL
jgi:pimeloyl-ACP methyl ester carboxylesterase